MPAWETTHEKKMTGIDPERLERRLRWAAEQLGLSPEASLDEVRAAWLRRLPQEDFVPSSELRWALAALLRRQTEGGWEARADEAASAAEEQRLRSKVEAFAETFWDLPPAERRRCWQELRDRCAFAPALRARLDLLQAGLDINAGKPSSDARVNELANCVRELFVLRPGSRARVRRDILSRMDGKRKEWIRAVRHLRRSSATYRLAALGNDLLDAIAIKKPKAKRLAKKQPSQPAPPPDKGRQVPRWIFIIIAVAASQFARIACNHNPPPTTMPNPLYPRIDDKLFPPKPWEKKDQFRVPTMADEFQKRLMEELLRQQQRQPDSKNDKPARKNP
jgi:hypothetical protein